MARHKNIPAKELAAALKRKRKVTAATRARIGELTENAVKRASLLDQAAVLEEVIETCREQVLKGIDSGMRNAMKAQKQLSDLLQNRAPDRVAAGGKAGLASAPRWLPEAKPAPPPPVEAPRMDDAELNEMLAADVAAHAVKQ